MSDWRVRKDDGCELDRKVLSAGALTHGFAGYYQDDPFEALAAKEEEELYADEEQNDGELGAMVSGLFAELFQQSLNPRRVGLMVYYVAYAVCPDLIRLKLKLKEQREVMNSPVGGFPDMQPEWMRGLLTFMLGKYARRWNPERLGRRAMCFAYIQCRAQSVRRVLKSYENLGELWGLRAKNKRSAVGEAMRLMKAEMVAVHVRAGGKATDVVMPGEKDAETKLKYKAAQMGNVNRRKNREVMV